MTDRIASLIAGSPRPLSTLPEMAKDARYRAAFHKAILFVVGRRVAAEREGKGIDDATLREMYTAKVDELMGAGL